MICYNEYGEDAPVKITRAEAISRQRAASFERGYRYETDEEALYDFMVIYWAWKEDPE